MASSSSSSSAASAVARVSVGLNSRCAICNDRRHFRDWILCEQCDLWQHVKCGGMSIKHARKLEQSGDSFFCKPCAGFRKERLAAIKEKAAAKAAAAAAAAAEADEPEVDGFDGFANNTDDDYAHNGGDEEDDENDTGSIAAPPRTCATSPNPLPGTIMPDTAQLVDSLAPTEGGGVFSSDDDSLASGGGRAPSTPGNTDEETGYKAISGIVAMRDVPCSDDDDTTETETDDAENTRHLRRRRRRRNNNNNHRTRREFKVSYKVNKFEEWLREEALDGAVDVLNAFLETKGRSPTKLEYRDGLGSGCGTSNSNAPHTNKRNFASPSKIIDAVRKYGKPAEYLQPEVMKPGVGLALGKDAIYLLKVHEHAFVLLWLHKLRLVFVCDGEDAFYRDAAFRQAVMARLAGARLVRALRFRDQREQDHCASSAVAIAIEFGRLHKRGELPEGRTLWCNRSALAKVRRVLHKEPGMVRLKPAQAVQNRLTRARPACDKCGWKSAKTANRTGMHLHKCTKDV